MGSSDCKRDKTSQRKMISQRKQNLVKIDLYRSFIIDSGYVVNQIMKILGDEKVQNNVWVTSRNRRMEIEENSCII